MFTGLLFSCEDYRKASDDFSTHVDQYLIPKSKEFGKLDLKNRWIIGFRESLDEFTTDFKALHVNTESIEYPHDIKNVDIATENSSKITTEKDFLISNGIRIKELQNKLEVLPNICSNQNLFYHNNLHTSATQGLLNIHYPDNNSSMGGSFFLTGGGAAATAFNVVMAVKVLADVHQMSEADKAQKKARNAIARLHNRIVKDKELFQISKAVCLDVHKSFEPSFKLLLKNVKKLKEHNNLKYRINRNILAFLDNHTEAKETRAFWKREGVDFDGLLTYLLVNKVPDQVKNNYNRFLKDLKETENFSFKGLDERKKEIKINLWKKEKIEAALIQLKAIQKETKNREFKKATEKRVQYLENEVLPPILDFLKGEVLK